MRVMWLSLMDYRIGYLPQEFYTRSTKSVFDEAMTAFDEVITLQAEIKRMETETSSTDRFRIEIVP